MTGVIVGTKLTPMMTKTQVYLPKSELRELHRVAKRTGKSVAQLVREAVRRSCLPTASSGLIGLWDGAVRKTSFDHDSIYDQP